MLRPAVHRSQSAQMARTCGAPTRVLCLSARGAPSQLLLLRSTQPSFSLHRASFATDTAQRGSRKKNQSLPTLKGQLKKFYKLVHPDLFAAHPDARAANEAALTKLMGVADRFNKQPGGNPFAPPEAHQFTFYVMKKESQKLPAPEGEIPGGRVTVTELEGQPLLRVNFETKINAPYEHTKGAFAHLFSSLNIDPEFVLDEPDERVFPPSIEEFFRTYVGHARHKKDTYEAQSREEVELVKDIEAKTSGEVVHLPDVSEAPLEERLQVLRAFLEVLPKMACANLLHGQSIAFQAPFTGTYYDRERQVICFDPLADALQWASFVDLKLSLPQYAPFLKPKDRDVKRAAASFLDRAEKLKRKNSEVGGAAKRKEMTTERKIAEKQEKQLASLMNLKSLGFPLREYNRGGKDKEKDDEHEEDVDDGDDPYSTNSSKEMNTYRGFLERFLKPATVQELQKWMNLNPKRAKAFKNTEVLVRDFVLPKRWSVSPDGRLYIASNLDRPLELLAALEEAGPVAAVAATEYRKREEMKQYIQTRLGLTGMATHRLVYSLEKDAAVKMRNALERLQQSADELRELNLRGQNVVLSHKYAISDDGMLFIPWNFQFEPKEPKRLAKSEEVAKDK